MTLAYEALGVVREVGDLRLAIFHQKSTIAEMSNVLHAISRVRVTLAIPADAERSCGGIRTLAARGLPSDTMVDMMFQATVLAGNVTRAIRSEMQPLRLVDEISESLDWIEQAVLGLSDGLGLPGELTQKVTIA